MANLSTKNLKIAIQKEGRLTEETIEFLQKAGLEFGNYKQRLFSSCRNFPLEILFVRDDDIPNYVASGTADLGIVGQNLLYEKRPKVKKLLNLRFGFCSLIIASPKDSDINKIQDLEGKTIATTYPNSTKFFFKKNNINIKTFVVGGSVELTPALGVADAIADISATGSSLALNELRLIDKIYDIETVLIANNKTVVNEEKKETLEKLVSRFKAVLSAKSYKSIIMNVPYKNLAKLKKMIPCLKSPIVSPVQADNSVSIQIVAKEDSFWEMQKKLETLGVNNIVILPIEKIIS